MSLGVVSVVQYALCIWSLFEVSFVGLVFYRLAEEEKPQTSPNATAETEDYSWPTAIAWSVSMPARRRRTIA